MSKNLDAFAKNLTELRELDSKGADADPEKFDMLAKPLAWILERNFVLPMSDEHEEFIRLLTTSNAAGEYWKGYGDAWTKFLLRLAQPIYQEITYKEKVVPSQEKHVSEIEKSETVQETPEAVSKAPTGFIMD